MPKITVEPILAFTLLLVVMSSIISKEYIYHRVASQRGLMNATESNMCDTHNVSENTARLQAEVEAEASQWNLYLSLAGFTPSLVTTVFLGSWGDTVGRKLPLFIGCFGLMVMAATYIGVIHFQLPLAVLLAGRAFSGTCGDYPVVLCCCFAYIGDISSAEKRTLRIAAAEASLSLGGIIGSLISGIWVDAQGYENPLWLLVSGMVFSMAYIIFILPESLNASVLTKLQRLRRLFSLKCFQDLWNFLKADQTRAKRILSFITCFFLAMNVVSGFPSILLVLELAFPLCFSNALAGYASACFTASSLLGFAFIALTRNYLNDFFAVIISIKSSIAMVIVTAVARMKWIMFLGICLGCLQSLTIVICRSIVSRLAGPSEQGAVFALIACSESIAGITGGLAFSGIFAATAEFFQPTVFIIAVGMDLLILVLFGVTYRLLQSDLKSPSVGKYNIVENEESFYERSLNAP